MSRVLDTAVAAIPVALELGDDGHYYVTADMPGFRATWLIPEAELADWEERAGRLLRASRVATPLPQSALRHNPVALQLVKN